MATRKENKLCRHLKCNGINVNDAKFVDSVMSKDFMNNCTSSTLSHGRFGFRKTVSKGVTKTKRFRPSKAAMERIKKTTKDKVNVMIPYDYYGNHGTDGNHCVGLVFNRPTKSLMVFDCAFDTKRFQALNKDIRRVFALMGMEIESVSMQDRAGQWPVASGCVLVSLCLAKQIYDGHSDIVWPSNSEAFALEKLVYEHTELEQGVCVKRIRSARDFKIRFIVNA